MGELVCVGAFHLLLFTLLPTGTPLLDIKPYLPFDSVSHPRVPDWVQEWGTLGQFKRRAVSFTPKVEKFLQHAVHDGQLDFYGPDQDGHAALLAALREVLSLDVRAGRHGRGQSTGADERYMFRFDQLELVFVTLDEGMSVVDAKLRGKGEDK